MFVLHFKFVFMAKCARTVEAREFGHQRTFKIWLELITSYSTSRRSVWENFDRGRHILFADGDELNLNLPQKMQAYGLFVYMSRLVSENGRITAVNKCRAHLLSHDEWIRVVECFSQGVISFVFVIAYEKKKKKIWYYKEWCTWVHNFTFRWVPW